jgi:hypothetical protein
MTEPERAGIERKMAFVARSLLAVLLLLLLAVSSWAVTAPRIEVEAPFSLAPIAARLSSLPPDALTGPMRLTGLEDPGPPIRVFLGTESSDLAQGVPPWISGYAYGEQGVIVLLPGRVPNYPDTSIDDLLRHEVAHVLVTRAAGGRPLPRWFHEGLAMISGSDWGSEDRAWLGAALAARGDVRLSDLDELFAGGRGDTARAYAVAGAFVQDLFGRFGDRVAARLLAGVARGQSFEEAFRSTTGESLADAERSFWRRQTFWHRWVPALTSSFALWMFVTVLALLAIARRRSRDAALRQLWEEEDRRLAAIPPIPPLSPLPPLVLLEGNETESEP